jgi:hypothetical protein
MGSEAEGRGLKVEGEGQEGPLRRSPRRHIVGGKFQDESSS